MCSRSQRPYLSKGRTETLVVVVLCKSSKHSSPLATFPADDGSWRPSLGHLPPLGHSSLPLGWFIWLGLHSCHFQEGGVDRGSSCLVRLGTLFRTTWDILFHVSKVLSGRTEVSVAAAVFTLATGILLLTSNLLGLWLAECTHPAASFLGILGLCEAVISRLGKPVCV